MAKKAAPLKICNTVIQPGERVTLALPTPEIYSCAQTYVPVHVMHGRKEGPCLLVTAAMHGDEMNGIAIIHRMLQLKQIQRTYGTIIAIPVLNVHGLITGSRTTVDRHDLGSAFPGECKGSHTERLAHLLDQEIISKATHIIDLHTGGPHIKKHPQVVTSLQNEESKQMAEWFGSPVILHDDEDTTGMLWNLKREEKPIPTIMYSAGQAGRLNEIAIKTGLKGVVRVMRGLGMLGRGDLKPTTPPLHIKGAKWATAPKSGLCHSQKKVGSYVKEGEVIALIDDPFSPVEALSVLAPVDGVLLSIYTDPMVNEGEGIYLIGLLDQSSSVATQVAQWETESNIEDLAMQ